MHEINLKQLINDYPECVTNGAKLKAILLDTYPEASKGIINAILIISNSGIAREIQNSANIDKIATDRWLKKLENDYCMSGSTVEKCLQLWINAFTSKFMSPLLNASPTVIESQICDWIARKGEYDEIDEKICKDLSDYIINCSYIINKMKKNLGFAYFMLAKGLHVCDSDIRDCEPEEYYESKARGYNCSHLRWTGYVNEIDAICELINIKTKNINILIEQLLTLSWENCYQAAAIALLSTYTDKYSYDDLQRGWDDWYEEEKLVNFPWFDITCMDQDFDSFEVDWYYVKVEVNKAKTYKLYYARKALMVLQKYKNLFTGDYTSDNAPYISDIASYYKKLELILNVEFYEKYFKQELPFIKLYADKNNPDMIQLVLDYYRVFDSKTYLANLIKYSEDGNYETQCDLAYYYNRQFQMTHIETCFNEASKWYELAINNKSRESYDTYIVKEYKSFLESIDKEKYADKIKELS